MRKLIAVLFFAAPLVALAQERPTTIVLVEDAEPGERLDVYGTVYGSDGETPLAGIRVHAYHTDTFGLYAPEDAPPGTRRIAGDVWTDAEGRFHLHTILPGSYPDGRSPAHIHFIISGPDVPEQHLELFFENDPDLSDNLLRREHAKGSFSAIRELEKTEDGAAYLSSIKLRVRQ